MMFIKLLTYSTRKLISILSIVLICFLFSCRKNVEVNKPEAPIVDSVFPKYVANGDEITIIGKNFGNNGTENTVKINDLQVKAKSSGRVIKLRLPDNFFSASVLVSSTQVVLDGKESEKVEKSFYSVEYPVLENFIPMTIKVGDELTIYGYNFLAGPAIVQFFDINGRSINGKVINISPEIIKVIVPDNAVSGNFQLIVITNDRAHKNAILDSHKSLRIVK